MSLVCAMRARLRDDQSGFTMIEVMVSAVMVVLVSVGVLKTLDAAQARSGEQKSKSVAAGLAQQDQERLRAFRVKELSNLFETRTKTVGTQAYKVISRSDWVSDQSGTRSCGTGARADYLRISSTVVWIQQDEAETGSQRVSLSSIVAPRVGSFGDEGSLAIEILDRNAVGREGVDVSVTGPKALSGKTDPNGCLFFGYLPQGNYSVNVSEPPLIDVAGNTNVSRPFGVVDGSVTSAVIELDQAATLDLGFQAIKAGTATTVASQADNVTIAHPSLLAPGWQVKGNGTPQPNHLISNLFPFTSGYAVYSGDCPGNNPGFYPPAVAQFATLSPGAITPLTVSEATVKLLPGTGWPGDTIPTAGVSIKLVPRTTWLSQPTYCGGSKAYMPHQDPDSGAGVWLANPDQTDLGVPFGAYDLCLTYNDGLGDLYRTVSDAALLPLTNKDGVTVQVDKPIDLTPTSPC
jgi:Tfp pilus assembly protein PilV